MGRGSYRENRTSHTELPTLHRHLEERRRTTLRHYGYSRSGITTIHKSTSLQDTLELLSPMFPKEVALLKHCLTSSYFLWNNQLYSQRCCTSKPSQGCNSKLLHRTSWKEHLGIQSISTYTLMHVCGWCICLVDHGQDKLKYFSDHLNNIRFSKENEKKAFLNILIERIATGRLDHRVYKMKAINTDRYLNATSKHHPAQKAML